MPVVTSDYSQRHAHARICTAVFSFSSVQTAGANGPAPSIKQEADCPSRSDNKRETETANGNFEFPCSFIGGA